ncbi:ABC transporter permease [Lentzea xinjiangensis]|uniref:ABC transporter permease n=1 Tax=Lentzea xinjiangensis TaxID=402600 RepID=UPI0015A708A0|nr:FtsX-like permease family protein [Lentzea xinjiangensis]
MLVVLDIGLCVAVLLFAAAAIDTIGSSSDREAARAPVLDKRAGVTPLSLVNISSAYRGSSISGRQVRGGPLSPVPPGVPAIPGPGEVFVSPELARLLDSDPALRARFGGTRAGLIEPSGLVDAGELYFYEGVDRLPDDRDITTAYAFGDERRGGTTPAEMILVSGVAVVLLAPLLVFIACVGRLGGVERDQRLATLRLLGATAPQVRRIAAAESLAGAVAGLAVGVAMFFAVHRRVDGLQVGNFRFSAADFVPPWWRFALVLLIVLVLVVGAVLLGMRSTVVEPLSVTRDSGAPMRRLRWRLLPAASGVAFLLPIALDLVHENKDVTMLVSCAIASALVAIPVLLPWLVERAVAPLTGGLPSWQLAVRRLQVDSGTPSRVVGGIAVVLAAAVGGQTIITSVAGLHAGTPDLSELQAHRLSGYTDGLYLLSAFTLLAAGASLLVLVVQQLGERRRAVAALSAIGVPWQVIGRSLLWQNLIPIGFGVLVANLAGAGLAVATLHVLGAPAVFDWRFAGAVSIGAVLTVCFATVLGIPVLRASARLDALRSE